MHFCKLSVNNGCKAEILGERRRNSSRSATLIPLRAFSTLRSTFPRGFTHMDLTTIRVPSPLIDASDLSCCSFAQSPGGLWLASELSPSLWTHSQASPCLHLQPHLLPSPLHILPAIYTKPPLSLQMCRFFLPWHVPVPNGTLLLPLSAETPLNTTSSRQSSLHTLLPPLCSQLPVLLFANPIFLLAEGSLDTKALLFPFMPQS